MREIRVWSAALLVALLTIVGAAVQAQETGQPAPPAAEAGAAPSAEAQQEEQFEGAVEVPVPGEMKTESRTLQDWYALGGWIMHFLVGCSVIAFALVLERTWNLRRNSVIPRKFLREVNEHLHRREMMQVLALCAAADSSIARVLKSGLIHFREGLARIEDAIETAGAHEETALRRNLPLLGALANIATMLGLLGTVLGMIESFDLIARTGTGDARVVASGIFQALVTTAAGLMVGIPTIAFYSFFRRRADVLVIELEEISMGLIQNLAQDQAEEPLVDAAPTAPDLTPAEA